MDRIGIVDLGSNTARLVVFEYESGSWFVLKDEIRERVRLGQGLGRGGEVPEEAIRRAAAALDLFKGLRGLDRPGGDRGDRDQRGA